MVCTIRGLNPGKTYRFIPYAEGPDGSWCPSNLAVNGNNEQPTGLDVMAG